MEFVLSIAMHSAELPMEPLSARHEIGVMQVLHFEKLCLFCAISRLAGWPCG